MSKDRKLAAFIQWVAGDPSVDQLTMEASKLAAEGVGAEYGAVVDGDSSVVAAHSSRVGLSGRDQAQASQAQANFALSLREPVAVMDLRAETRFPTSEMTRFGLASGVCAVIPRCGGGFGVLGAFRTRRRRFSDADISFVETVANIVGMVIEREQTRSRLPCLQGTLYAPAGMAATAAHQFNNTLATINLYSELLSSVLDLSTVASDYLAAIRQQVEDGVALTHDLLGYADRPPGRVATFEVGGFVQRLLPFLRLAAAPRVLVQKPAAAPSWVQADPACLQEILVCSVSRTAWDAGGPGMTIEVIAPGGRCEEGQTDQSPERSQTLVIDMRCTSGSPAISCCDAFRKHLAALARALGGRIDFAAAGATDASIRLWLPHCEGPSAAHGRVSDLPRGRQEPVMVIEAEAAMRRGIVDLVRWLGYEPIEATNPSTAKAALKDRSATVTAIIVGD
ncbi:MAG: GAF domain-containing protein, partial [Acidimicrobiales bacterium]